ncbi:centromere protein U isoform X1 [Ailuropoda melanoleuca]|uniref:Centromere protein U n=1 Tax=Ailuropoda melanoleuca TaxID=9646 RepID=G1LPG1_AILME|nr:centromere protein U isoform X1 [Ailuropoda melanoleuca]
MAPPGRVRSPGRGGVRSSKNTVGRTHSTKDKAGPKRKPTDVFDFPDNSVISSISRLGDNEKDEEPYEIFDPPLHSTAIYADEELSKHCASPVPSTPRGEEAEQRSDTYEIEAGENVSIEMNAKKPGRKVRPISDDSESTEEGDIRRKVQLAEKIRTRPHKPVPETPCTSLELPEKPAKSVTPKKIGPRGAKSVVAKEMVTEPRQSETQKKMFCGKRKKSRSEATDSDTSDSVSIWCLEGKKASDITELDVVLSAFEKTILEYKQKVESKICKEAIKKFHSNMKEELIKMLKEVQVSKTLKRKNTKIISDIEKKRQRLLELQDELLGLDPQLKQLQIKYDELKERRASLRNAACFLSNLKQLHQDYLDIQEKEPYVKETYDSSSLPALLLKARTLLGAGNHLQNINHQLEKLLDQKDRSTGT